METSAVENAAPSVGLDVTALPPVESPDRPPVESPDRVRGSRSVWTAIPLAIGDLCAVVCAGLAAGAFTMLFFPGQEFHSLHLQLFTLAQLVIVIFPFFGLYPGAGMHPAFELRQLVVATTVAFVILLIANVSFGEIIGYERWFLPIAWCLALVAVPLSRKTARLIASRFNWWGLRVLVFGEGKRGFDVYSFLRGRPTLGLRPVGIVADPHEQWMDDRYTAEVYLGPPSEMASIAKRHGVSTAIVALEYHSSRDVAHIIRKLARSFPNVIVLPQLGGVPSVWNRTHECAGELGILIQERLLLTLPRLIKRTMDVTLVMIGGLFALPLIAMIALFVRLTSSGPVFFRQMRVGKEGQLFSMWKFRTMFVDADRRLEEYLAANPELRAEWEQKYKLKNDPRVTIAGRFLRRTSLDELPQLWNVLRGEMSLVGPRALPEYHLEVYDESFRALRQRVRPGITGWWQVNGRSNGTACDLEQLDTYYMRNWSPWLDLLILGRTIIVVCRQNGAY